jgi:hypothetical protein
VDGPFYSTETVRNRTRVWRRAIAGDSTLFDNVTTERDKRSGCVNRWLARVSRGEEEEEWYLFGY